MKSHKKVLTALSAACLAAAMTVPACVNACEFKLPAGPKAPAIGEWIAFPGWDLPTPPAPIKPDKPVPPAPDKPAEDEVIESAYSYEVNGDRFSFVDSAHAINIDNGSSGESTVDSDQMISFYGLNDDGSLTIVYFNAAENEGRSAVISNTDMVYVSYSKGRMTEVKREIGTLALFGFDLANADNTLPGMEKVFTASLGSFIMAYAASIQDYSSLSSSGISTGAVQYVDAKPLDLYLMDGNYITNRSGSKEEAFLANELGIYSGYCTIDGIDYNSFCFIGSNNDAYYFGYGNTADGLKVMTMKGDISTVNDRTKRISLRNVNMAKTSDKASQYITKLAGCLMGAQGYPSVDLDTIQLTMSFKFSGRRLTPVIIAKTDSASGTLTLNDGVYTGTISDGNGASEELSIKVEPGKFIVTTKTSGVFTVANNGMFGSLKAGANRRHVWF